MSQSGFKELHVLEGISCSLVTPAAESIGPSVTVKVCTLLGSGNESSCDVSPLVIIITIYSLALSEKAFVVVRLAGALGTEQTSLAALNRANKSGCVVTAAEIFGIDEIGWNSFSFLILSLFWSMTSISIMSIVSISIVSIML